jgi:hypothetical protein
MEECHKIFAVERFTPCPPRVSASMYGTVPMYRTDPQRVEETVKERGGKPLSLSYLTGGGAGGGGGTVQIFITGSTGPPRRRHP